MGHIQKIMLLVLIVPLTLFPGGWITYVLLYEQPQFEFFMWIPIGLSILGVCSFIFHFKTFKYYKLLEKNVSLPKVEPILWVLDVFFGIGYILISCHLLYVIFLIRSLYPWKVLLLFIIPMILVGLWTVIEAVYLHKLVKIHEFSNRDSEIQEIKGRTGE